MWIRSLDNAGKAEEGPVNRKDPREQNLDEHRNGENAAMFWQ